jgi:hypothetical protein
MRSKRQIVGIVFLVLAALVIGCISAWHYAYGRSRATLRHAESSFEKDVEQNLPLGTDQSRAIEFLKARRMRYTELDARIATWRHEPWYNDATDTIEAITTTEVRTSLFDCSMFLELKFDKNKKLIGYRDKMPCTEYWG